MFLISLSVHMTSIFVLSLIHVIHNKQKLTQVRILHLISINAMNIAYSLVCITCQMIICFIFFTAGYCRIPCCNMHHFTTVYSDLWVDWFSYGSSKPRENNKRASDRKISGRIQSILKKLLI